MNFFRKLLFPLAVLYGFVTSVRNFLYDKGILKSYSFDLPVIAVGNLSVGGTGKTPQIEYLIRLLSDRYKVATLSRGYKRKSKGFVLADAGADAAVLGDEPFQFHQKFPNIQVAVDANRVNGITQLLSQNEKPDVILLDDAFQHRKVKAGFYIMLTAYGDLYCDDLILPAGNLRESRTGVKRADVIIVTKCPPQLTLIQQNEIRSRLQLKQHQQLFFTFIAYEESVSSEEKSMPVKEIATVDKILLAGIAKPDSFFAYLQAAQDATMTFPDHHDFTQLDIEKIKEKAKNKIIITTEKDYVRLKGKLRKEQLFYLPIKTSFLSHQEDFDKSILDYVGTSTGNR
ncbi:tetraacyldisaccharide 4'-kinase [Flavobacterium suncheonense]|uniref:Tetraacyldisaccharide 4'-kinase n=1 Tax=Flavobacterium suncheonense GH29-5 = DSM 17707 TaxID=1121899 RepID=A0A0A2MDB5_9FLAO|nr:tetraacyldisaccharide 4'-kinase [Flavobacterium suncheonense]KGO90264.1 tetraacyldisaccharide 4'-kinase [Flavobacterium suncheonense GH29-5 = DSM 17707]